MGIADAADINGLSGALLAITTIIVGLRFWSRHIHKTRVAADDWSMLVAQIGFLGMVICVFLSTRFRTLGYPSAAVADFKAPPKQGAEINHALDLIGSVSLGFTKLSALLFYQRLFCVRQRVDAFKVVLTVLMVLTMLWTIAYMILPYVQCGSHYSASWTPAIHARYCTISGPYIISHVATDMAFDVAIMIVPIPKIWRLNTSLKRRFGVLLIFATAAVALGASTARVVFGYYHVYDQTIGGDILVLNTKFVFVWVLEAGFAIIAINMPTLAWLRSSKAPEKILASVRSLMSVSSSVSKSSFKDSTGRRYSEQTDATRKGSTHVGSSEGVGTEKGYCHESHISREEGHVEQELPASRIYVKSNITQNFETV